MTPQVDFSRKNSMLYVTKIAYGWQIVNVRITGKAFQKMVLKGKIVREQNL